MVREKNFVEFYFGLSLENHAELNTKTNSVMITSAKGTGYSRGEKNRDLYTKIK